MSETIKIHEKNKVLQLFCKHDYQEGIVSSADSVQFYNLSGERHTTICVKCGKIKSSHFVRNFDE